MPGNFRESHTTFQIQKFLKYGNGFFGKLETHGYLGEIPQAVACSSSFFAGCWDFGWCKKRLESVSWMTGHFEHGSLKLSVLKGNKQTANLYGNLKDSPLIGHGLNAFLDVPNGTGLFTGNHVENGYMNKGKCRTNFPTWSIWDRIPVGFIRDP